MKWSCTYAYPSIPTEVDGAAGSDRESTSNNFRCEGSYCWISRSLTESAAWTGFSARAQETALTPARTSTVQANRILSSKHSG
jgi:hypothetical protein